MRHVGLAVLPTKGDEVPKITIKLTPYQLTAVQEIMKPEIEATLVRVDTTRKTASFVMDNPLEYVQLLTDTYDSKTVPRRVIINILRKVHVEVTKSQGS